MLRTSKIIVSKSALKNNIEFIRNLTSENTRLSIVVKSNAYGHGLKLFTKLAYEYGIDHFSVFCYDEANMIKKNLPQADVMVMGWISYPDISKAIKEDIEFYVFDLERLEAALASAKKLNKKAKIHLEVETGMNRTGLNDKEYYKALELIKKNADFFILKGICSHLAGPESIANNYRIQKQIKKFKKIKNYAIKHSIEPEYYHLVNSAGLIAYPNAQMDLVRVGIIAYGLWPSQETLIHCTAKIKKRKDPLRRVIRWESKIMAVKEIKTGEYVGYGNHYIANDDMKLAIIPVGYSNSFNRSFTNKGRVLIHGTRCSVIGVINMNMIIADVTGLNDVNIGDEVVIIGSQEDTTLSVSYFSDHTDQLNYETLSNLPLNIPREIAE